MLVNHATRFTGPNGVINGDGSATANWVASGATLSVAGGFLVVTNSGAASGNASQAVATIVGARYRFTKNSAAGTGPARVAVGTAGAGSSNIYDDAGTPGQATIDFTATGASTTITLFCNNAVLGANAQFNGLTLQRIAT